jgi:hypothetical protein
MSVGWEPSVLGGGADWPTWLLVTVALVACWGLVVAATTALFGGHLGGRSQRNGSPRLGRRHE